MPELLHNTTFFCGVAGLYNVNNVVAFLKERGGKVKVIKEVIKAVAGNTGSGKEVIALLLKQRGGEVKVIEEVVKAVAGNTGSGKEVMVLLLKY